jgi:hypothetical protein
MASSVSPPLAKFPEIAAVVRDRARFVNDVPCRAVQRRFPVGLTADVQPGTFLRQFAACPAGDAADLHCCSFR